MPQHVQASVFRLALVTHPRLGRDQGGFHEVPMLDDRAVAGWEHQFPMRAAQLPLLKSVRHDLAEGNRAIASFRLRRLDVVVPVGSLPDVQDAVLEADIAPA